MAFADDQPVQSVPFDWGAIEAEPIPVPAAASAVELVQDVLLVVLEMRPRKDTALPLLGAVGMLFDVPGCRTAKETAARLGISESALSRGRKRLALAIKCNSRT